MSITLSHPSQILKGEITLTSSKSESNRALIIQALCDDDFEVENLSISDDTRILEELLSEVSSKNKTNRAENGKAKSSGKDADNYQPTMSVGLAGTVMRFLTAFLAIQNKGVILTGGTRMKERPIKILVDVLRSLGAEIQYLEKDGYPPIKIIGKEIQGGKITIDGSVSSQYVSALLMIAPKLKNGIELEFKGEIISKPYIDMTIEMMRYFGVAARWKESSIIVEAGKYKARNFKVEADWSAASYWYSFSALSKEADITLYGLKKESLQGDAVLPEIYKNFGVETEFLKNGIRLTKNSEFRIQNSELKMNFVDCPDVSQTIAVTCAALNVKARLTGLKTLRIKETDRILAIQTELNKLGFNVEVVGDDIQINTSLRNFFHPEFNRRIDETNLIKTYNDHRMAMAFAPLALLGEITIENKNVVGKSYPNFWGDLESVGFKG